MEIQLWREILAPYELAVDELIVKFNHMIDEYRSVGLYSPIEQVHGRVKRISSILEKAQKKNVAISEINSRIDDIAGVRIICQFVEDIYSVVEIIKSRSDMEVKYEKDYVAHIKPSVIEVIIL
jgi:putative GTP pyrophosphokinase